MHSTGGVAKLFNYLARTVGSHIHMNVDHGGRVEATHVLVLRFDDYFVFVEGQRGLFDDLGFDRLVVRLRIGGDGPEIMASALGLWRYAMKTAHVEAAALRVAQRLGIGIHRTGPYTQVADVKFDFLPAIDLVLERISRHVSGGGTEPGM